MSEHGWLEARHPAPEEKPVRGIRAQIYRGDGDFSNGGISGRCKEVTIIDEHIIGPFEPTEDAPAVRLVRRYIGGKPSFYLTPVDAPEGMVGPMMGGCYVGSSDSRFAKLWEPYGAIPLHDRWETVEHYATYD